MLITLIGSATLDAAFSPSAVAAVDLLAFLSKVMHHAQCLMDHALPADVPLLNVSSNLT
jgi:hypothetical protein